MPAETIVHPATIYVREDGHVRALSREEWDAAFPGREPVTTKVTSSKQVYWANITHNLGGMASEAGIYKALWRPEEIGITTARQLIEPLEKGLELLKSDPARFEKLNSPNGWGTYKNFVPFVEKYLAACRDYPDALVEANR